MTIYFLGDPIFQRYSGIMDTHGSAHTEGRPGILTLNLSARGSEVGFGAYGVSGWEGDMLNEPIHLRPCFAQLLPKEVPNVFPVTCTHLC